MKKKTARRKKKASKKTAGYSNRRELMEIKPGIYKLSENYPRWRFITPKIQYPKPPKIQYPKPPKIQLLPFIMEHNKVPVREIKPGIYKLNYEPSSYVRKVANNQKTPFKTVE